MGIIGYLFDYLLNIFHHFTFQELFILERIFYDVQISLMNYGTVCLEIGNLHTFLKYYNHCICHKVEFCFKILYHF